MLQTSEFLLNTKREDLHRNLHLILTTDCDVIKVILEN